MIRWKNQKGYYELKVPDHPFANNKGYVREHRIIVEKHIQKTNPEHPCLIEIDGQKYIRPDWDVHHEGFNKTTKNPEKLLPIKHDEHARMHFQLREQAKKDTFEERKQILSEIVTDTIKKESENSLFFTPSNYSCFRRVSSKLRKSKKMFPSKGFLRSFENFYKTIRLLWIKWLHNSY